MSEASCLFYNLQFWNPNHISYYLVNQIDYLEVFLNAFPRNPNKHACCTVFCNYNSDALFTSP